MVRFLPHTVRLPVESITVGLYSCEYYVFIITVPAAVAVIALFNDTFVSNLQNIDELERWILIGIGYGIGSANKIVDRG
jgi:hypothetical protein